MTNSKTIRILGISGSPRTGSTDFVVNYALQYAKDKFKGKLDIETSYFSVRKKDINFCIHCDYCIRKQEGCIHKDDMHELYPLMEWADGWILGSPVYQGQVSGQLKTVMDRTRASVARDPKIFANKVGMAIAVGGDRAGGQEQTIHSILDFYIINEMVAIGGGSFGANLGGTVWSKDMGREFDADADKEGLRTVRKTVRKLVEMTAMYKQYEGTADR